MANYKGHLAGGVIAYLILFSFLKNIFNPSLSVSLGFLMSAMAGSLFPDIDTKSMAQKIFYRVVFVFFIYILLINKTEFLFIPGLVAIVPLLTNHRGLFHKIWFIFFIVFLLCFYFKYFLSKYFIIVVNYSIFFIAGVISHIILDFGLKGLIRR